eukprot:3607653-Alexandrium_andersonii.AAC.1
MPGAGLQPPDRSSGDESGLLIHPHVAHSRLAVYCYGGTARSRRLLPRPSRICRLAAACRPSP